MKMTMHIDEHLLRKVMLANNCASKTEAVDLALREMARKSDFHAMVAAPCPFSPDELRDAVYSDYEVGALRVAESEGDCIAGGGDDRGKRSR